MSLSGRMFAGLAKPLLMRFLSDRVIYYPGGDLSSGYVIHALVALDTELGTNEVPGDGAITKDVHGDRERRTGRIELDAPRGQIIKLTPGSPGGYTLHVEDDHTYSITWPSDMSVAEFCRTMASELNQSTDTKFGTLAWAAQGTYVTATCGPGLGMTIVPGGFTMSTLQSASPKVTESDLWSIDGELWTTQRQDGRDVGPNAGFQGWRITTKLGRRTQHSLVKDTRPIMRG